MIKSVCGLTGVSETKSEGEYRALYKEIADDEIKFYQYFRMSKHQFNYLLQKIEKDLKKNHLPRSSITCGETSNLSSVSALQVNVIWLKTFIEVTKILCCKK